MVMGAATRTGASPPRWPRFAVAELHRTLSLFTVALLGLHVVTAILDPYVAGRALARLPGLADGFSALAHGRERSPHRVGGGDRVGLGGCGGGSRARAPAGQLAPPPGTGPGPVGGIRHRAEVRRCQPLRVP